MAVLSERRCGGLELLMCGDGTEHGLSDLRRGFPTDHAVADSRRDRLDQAQLQGVFAGELVFVADEQLSGGQRE
jgi:hypothetical protein